MKFQGQLIAVNKTAADKQKKLDDIIIAQKDKQFKATQAFAQATISGAANAAAQEFLISRNAGLAARAAGADAIRTAANEAAKIIVIKGAEATAKAFAKGGGFPTGIPFAVATALAYTALAATVSAVGGIAAAAISPPSGGGGAAIPETPQGDFGAPLPVSVQGESIGEIETETESVNAPPGQTATNGGNTIIVNISGKEILDDDEVIRAIRNGILRDGAR